jgi:hypothetical protein
MMMVESASDHTLSGNEARSLVACIAPDCDSSNTIPTLQAALGLQCNPLYSVQNSRL